MKTSCFGVVLMLSILVCPGRAQTSAYSKATMGLRRLEQMADTKFAADMLSAQDFVGAQGGETRRVRFLALDAAREWSRPLRGGAKDLVFVSCSLYGSVGTQLEIGGARLRVAESDVLAYGQLVVEENGKLRGLGIHVPMDFHDGKILARFSVLTLRLDRAEGTWDLYHGARLVAEDLPLADTKEEQRFTLKAGDQGAMLNGLVQSDENPLYADTNGNGVDDAFEQQKQGRLLTTADGKATRKQLITDWRKHQRANPAPALFVNLPQPD
jgi:hypothetical protein